MLRWAVEQTRQELREPQPEELLVVQYLAQMIRIQALRVHLADGLNGGVEWLFALADQQMGLAINAIHADPAHRRTVQELAWDSESALSVAFKRVMGCSPRQYGRGLNVVL